MFLLIARVVFLSDRNKTFIQKQVLKKTNAFLEKKVRSSERAAARTLHEMIVQD